jgi:multisubunit Na+/H+ antiporter MnhG subunit
VREVVAAGLVGAAVALQALCCVGVARMPTALARLHYTMPAMLAALLAAAGLLVREGLSQTSGRALMLAALFTISGAPLAHATARAIRRRS